MMEFKSGTHNMMDSGAQQKLPASLLPVSAHGLRMPSPRAETVYQAATICRGIAVMMSV